MVGFVASQNEKCCCGRLFSRFGLTTAHLDSSTALACDRKSIKRAFMTTLPRQRRSALTAIDGIVILALAIILAALILPALRKAKAPRQVYCVSNLKQVTLSWLAWAHDHEKSEFPFRVPVMNEGTFGTKEPLRNNAWWQFAILSNEVGRPQVLVCPADRNVGLPRVLATNWSASRKQKGFLAEGFGIVPSVMRSLWKARRSSTHRMARKAPFKCSERIAISFLMAVRAPVLQKWEKPGP